MFSVDGDVKSIILEHKPRIYSKLFADIMWTIFKDFGH